jgi:hypothetical protein
MLLDCRHDRLLGGIARLCTADVKVQVGMAAHLEAQAVRAPEEAVSLLGVDDVGERDL